MLPFPMKWLAIQSHVSGTKTVLVDASATGDQLASFTSGRFAVVVVEPATDGSFDCTETPIIEDYNNAYMAFNEIGRQIAAAGL